jgi:L-amino acid N-acyltransferase YncA
LVAEDGGKVVRYASFGDFRPFDGYRLTVEHSVYVTTWHRSSFTLALASSKQHVCQGSE